MAENSGKAAAKSRGRPFPKGKSGNPGGRPKKPPQLKNLAERALAEIQSMIEDPETPERVRADLCKWVYEQQNGRAVQKAEIEGAVATGVYKVELCGELAEWAK